MNTAPGDDYRKQADERRARAERALKPEDKARWLGLAKEYLKLAEGEDRRGNRKPASD